jgi:hypothetical protein
MYSGSCLCEPQQRHPVFSASDRLRDFAVGYFVCLGPSISPDYGQVIDLTSNPPRVLVKLYPRIDYIRLRDERLVSQRQLNQREKPTYRPESAPFRPFPHWPLQKTTITIWGQNQPCLAWDGSLFIGEFQYRRFCPTELEIVDSDKLPKWELAKFMHLADFEAASPEILAGFPPEQLSESESDSLSPNPASSARLCESENSDETFARRGEKDKSDSDNSDSDDHRTEEQSSTYVESSISSDSDVIFMERVPPQGKGDRSDQTSDADTDIESDSAGREASKDRVRDVLEPPSSPRLHKFTPLKRRPVHSVILSDMSDD